MVAAAMRPVAVETAAAKLMTLAAAAGASGGGGSVACSSCLVRGEPCEAGAAQLSSMVPRCAAISCGASGRAGAAASVVTSSASDHVQLSPPPSALTRNEYVSPGVRCRSSWPQLVPTCTVRHSPLGAVAPPEEHAPPPPGVARKRGSGGGRMCCICSSYVGSNGFWLWRGPPAAAAGGGVAAIHTRCTASWPLDQSAGGASFSLTSSSVAHVIAGLHGPSPLLLPARARSLYVELGARPRAVSCVEPAPLGTPGKDW